LNSRYRKIKRFLERENFDGFTKRDLFILNFMPKAWGQDIAALSNMAEALRNLAEEDWREKRFEQRKEKIELLDRVVQYAIHPKVNPWKKPIDKVKDFNHYGYYLEHLNIILGCYLEAEDGKYLELNRRVTKYLHEESLAQPNAHARLLPHVKMRWSADQSAIIYSLWLYDKNNATDYHVEPKERWLSYMNTHGKHTETGMYITEVMGTKRYSKQPRGCSHAYMCYYMEHFASNEAHEQWGLFKKHMTTKVFGVWGFREYLRGYKGGWTPDSGPIIFGIGIAATGLALKPMMVWSEVPKWRGWSPFTRVRAWYFILNKISYIPLVGRLALIGSDLLASSIILAAETTSEKYVPDWPALWD
jgi:hypothetical protein